MNMDRQVPLRQAKALLRELGLKAKKRLGQHFLVDESALKKIVEAAELDPEDVVIEVGPGLGILTRELARRAALVIALEMDEEMVRALRRTMRDFSNIIVLKADVLQVDPTAVLREHAVGLATRGYKVVANLPYYITSPVLRHFLEASLSPRLMVVTVQREVGKRIIARPGEMSLLSVAVQVYGQPKIVTSVPPRSFYPAPKVSSVVLHIQPHSAGSAAGGQVQPTREFFTVVRAGFSAPRKQLRNALGHGLGLPPDRTVAILEKSGIAPERRAETLSLEEWEKLRETLSGERETIHAQS
jgi:16S rRNA (adenine1518-N6/adenine1519-N6)-dimethyltransferase